MGLFKAAIIIGGGAYAIKKLSKSREEKKQCRAGYDQNMSAQQQQHQQYRDYPDQQQQYQNQYYGDEKKSHNQNQNQSEKTRGLDGGSEQRYYDFDPAAATNQQAVATIHPQALEFVDRRSPSPNQQQYPPSSQPWRLSNSHNQPLPQSNAYSQPPPPPPSYHPAVGQQDMKRGFVEPEELSWSGSPPPPTAWDRKGRRESGTGRGGFGNGGGDWKNSGSVSPKEYLENHLSR